MRFSLLWSIPLAVLACPVQANDTSSEPVRLTMAWNLGMDAQGHVTRLDALANKSADRVPQVRDRLAQAIHDWQFAPGAINGHPAPTDTSLTVNISLLPQGNDAYRIRVDDARTGGRVAKSVPPRYPESAVRSFITGLVVVRVDYDADGKVISAKLEEAAPKPAVSLAKAALDSVKHWSVQPELVGGHGVAGTADFPVCFAIFPLGAHPSGADMSCGGGWTPPGHATALGEGEALAIDSAIHVLTEIAGRTL